MSSSKPYSLHYFDGRGRAEVIRMIFAQVDEKFQENRYHFFDEWPKVKNNMPLSQVPVLEINGEKYPQSVAIARYIARQSNFAGKDDFESFKCDIIVDTVQDINNSYYRAWFHINDEQQKKEEQRKFLDQYLSEKLLGVEKLMNQYGNGVWAVGDNVTWADLVVYDMTQILLKLDEKLLNKYTALKRHSEAVEKLPKIIEYMANRKETDY